MGRILNFISCVMENDFKVGDVVKFIDDLGGGKILKILNKKEAIIEADTGFNEQHPLSSLIKVNVETNSSYAYRNIPLIIKKSEQQQKKQTKKVHMKGPVWKVDLHIENLIPNHKNLRNYEIVQYQLQYCQQTIERALLRKVYKLVIIHGKGEGILREEIHNLLRRCNLEYRDAIFEQYGGGSTEVYLFK